MVAGLPRCVIVLNSLNPEEPQVEHSMAEARIIKRYANRKLYDTESSVTGQTWTWKNDEARLSVRSDFEERSAIGMPSVPRSVIEIGNTWSEHVAAEAQRFREERDAQAQERLKDDARRARERAAEAERLRRLQHDAAPQ